MSLQSHENASSTAMEGLTETENSANMQSEGPESDLQSNLSSQPNSNRDAPLAYFLNKIYYKERKNKSTRSVAESDMASQVSSEATRLSLQEIADELQANF